MKSKYISLIMMLLVLSLITFASGKEDLLPLRGYYLGQRVPGLFPRVFAPDIISTDLREFNPSFSPDLREFYYTIWTRSKGYQIYYTKWKERGWTRPKIAPFSGKYGGFDAAFSMDGQKIFFCSKRPIPGRRGLKSGFDIWYVSRKLNGWNSPQHLEGSVNKGNHQIYPSLSNNGNLYFSTSRKGGLGKRDVYQAKLIRGKYPKIKNLGKNINSKFDEGDAFIAADESYIIVASTGRPGNLGSGDLYISFKQPNGSWAPSIHLDPPLNTPSSEYCPRVSPDGKYLFFTSSRRGSDDIFWVDAKILEYYRSNEKKD